MRAIKTSAVVARFLISLLLFGISLSSHAAASLADLLVSARDRDPAYAIANAQLQAVGERKRQARAGLLPVVNFTGSATKSNFDEDGVQDRRFSTQQWAYQLTQPLFRPANYYALTQAQKQLAQAEAQLAAAESDLAGRVATAWFDVLTAQEVLRAIQVQKDATQQQLATAKRSFELGAVSVADAREAEAKHAVVLAQEAQAESELLIKREALALMTGTAVAELDAQPWMKPDLGARLGKIDEWMSVVEESNPTLVQVRYQVEAARLEISKARAGHSPTVDLIVNHSYNHASGSATTTFPQHNKTTQYGVQVTVPLFAGFSTDAKVGEAIALRGKAEGERNQARDQVTLNVRQAYLGLRGALAQIAALEAAQSASKVSAQATLRGYQVGLRTNVDVLNAQAQLFQTDKDLAKARADAWLNYIRLRILTGQWTEEDLNAF